VNQHRTFGRMDMTALFAFNGLLAAWITAVH
jgi:hypothetical protein